MTALTQKFAALSGGVGGAKLVLGLSKILPPGNLQVVVNTGDDFDHLGLRICPDTDTLIYTLADDVNPQTGWGIREETWHFMEALTSLGGEDWFRLGDRDLATHVTRTCLLAAGESISEITQRLAAERGIDVRIHPMSDDNLRTHIDTADGLLSFQDYFVRLGTEPAATAVRYCGADTAAAGKGALDALTSAELAGIIICPSNPWLSVAPILSVAELKSSILQSTAPVVAVSPIVAGKAIKGPTAKLMTELGVSEGVIGIAEYYRDVIDGLVVDQQDKSSKAAIEKMGIKVATTNTIMNKLADKTRLADFVISFVTSLGKKN